MPKLKARRIAMDSLEEFYNARVDPLYERDFLAQVGHTEGGRPLTPVQFQIMVDQIRDLLASGRNDRLLDCACGNGVITAVLERDVQAAVGVDISGRLAELAQRYHANANLRFYHHDALQLNTLAELQGASFSRIVMHAALQHFSPTDLEPLLRAMLSVAADDVVIVLGFVPCDGRQKYFYNTLRRRLSNTMRLALRRDFFGTWWRNEQLSDVCARLGLSCSFHEIDPRLDAARYRCNIRIIRDSTN